MSISSDSRLRDLSLLGGLCLFLSLVEYMIPKPVPFLRLGLANLPIIIALPFLSWIDLLILTGLKVFGQGLAGGSLFSYVFLFSLLGSFSSSLSMKLISYIPTHFIGFIGTSLTGALFSSLTQLFLAVSFIFDGEAILMAPLFLGSGLVSGLLMGISAEYFTGKSNWYSLLKQRWAKS